MKLLASADRKRFFLIPDDTSLPPGAFELSTMGGDVLRVRGESVDAFEIPSAVAKAFAAERAGQMTGELADFQVKMEQMLNQAQAQMSQITQAAGFGRSPEELLGTLGIDGNADRDTVLRRLAEMAQTLGSDLPKVVDGTLSAQAKMAQLDKTLGGTPERDPVKELLDTVAAPGTSPELQKAARELAEFQARLRGQG